MDANAWTALGTWVLIVGTLITVYWQARQQRRINSANMVMSLHDRFQSERMVGHRRRLSTFLLASDNDAEPPPEVLMFLETIGLLVHEGVIELRMVWNEFCWEIVRYYKAVRHPADRLAAMRSRHHDSTIFSELEWLYTRMIELDARHRTIITRDAEPGLDDIRNFLKDEAQL